MRIRRISKEKRIVSAVSRIIQTGTPQVSNHSLISIKHDNVQAAAFCFVNESIIRGLVYGGGGGGGGGCRIGGGNSRR